MRRLGIRDEAKRNSSRRVVMPGAPRDVAKADKAITGAPEFSSKRGAQYCPCLADCPTPMRSPFGCSAARVAAAASLRLTER